MNENNKSTSKKPLFVILIIVVIVALGLILYQYSGKEQPGPQEQGETEEGETEEISTTSEEVGLSSEQTREIMKKILRPGDASLCEQLEEKDKKKCNIIQEAVNKANDSFCYELEKDKKVMEICEDNVVILVAIKQGDSDSCERLADKTRIDQCKKEVTPEGEE